MVSQTSWKNPKNTTISYSKKSRLFLEKPLKTVEFKMLITSLPKLRFSRFVVLKLGIFLRGIQISNCFGQIMHRKFHIWTWSALPSIVFPRKNMQKEPKNSPFLWPRKILWYQLLSTKYLNTKYHNSTKYIWIQSPHKIYGTI